MPLKPAATHTARPRGTTTLLALATLTLVSACRPGDETPPVEVRPVRVTTIETRAIGDTIALTGTVQAQTEINESFRIGGRLIERNVEIGDTVRPGQLLARLDPQNEESGLQAARAQLVAAQAQLVEARNNHQRMRDLVAENAVSRAAFDQAVAVLQTVESQVNSARANVNLAENRLSYTQLNATAAGIVTARGAEPGEVVGAGSMVVQVAREGARDAVFDVPAQVKDSAARRTGITVALVDDPKITATGTVREVSPRADPVTGTFAVRVQLNRRADADAPRQHGHGPHQARHGSDDPDSRRRPDARRRRCRGVGIRPRDRDRRRAWHHRRRLEPGDGTGCVRPEPR